MVSTVTLDAQIPIYWVPVLKSLCKFILFITQRPTIWIPGLLGLHYEYGDKLISATFNRRLLLLLLLLLLLKLQVPILPIRVLTLLITSTKEVATTVIITGAVAATVFC